MDREKLIVKTSFEGIIMNLVLVAGKAAVGFAAGSIAVVLDALNNLTDVLSAVVTIVGTKMAGRAPDKEHPYGHGRIEYLTALALGLIIFATGASALLEAVPKIFSPTLADYSLVSLLVISVAVLAKFFFGRHAKKIGQTINSSSLTATGVDATFDALLSFSTLLGALVTMFIGISLEGWLGVIISIFIVKSSLEILGEAWVDAIGARPDGKLSRAIKHTVETFPSVSGAYDLILHNYGPNQMIGSVHIQIPDSLTAQDIHKLTREISEKVYQKYRVILTVGIYAENTSTKAHQEIKQTLEQILKNHSEILQMHGFYIDETKKLIAFDLVLDFKAPNKATLKSQIIRQLKTKYPSYKYTVTLDADLSD